MSKQLYLASTSFRRQELLKWLGIPFQIIPPQFDEPPFSVEQFPDVRAYVQTLSIGKALSVIDTVVDGIILTADTMVALEGEVIGKPDNLDHAREILTKLMGRSHEVYTGFTVWDVGDDKYETHLVGTKVWFKDVDEDLVEKYVQSGEPLGKAGAYGLQDNARTFLDHIEGSMTNVIGLPLIEVSNVLKKFEINSSVNVSLTISRYLGVAS